MPLFDELNAGSFRGVPFLLDSNELESGRKIVSHEFPNKKERFVEDLGGLLRVFKIKATITEPNYKSNRDALIAALETPGIGTLIHPLYGSVQVVPEPFTLLETMTRLGEATFDLVFREATENLFPTQSFDNQGLINQLAGTSLNNATSAMGNIWNVGTKFRNNFQNAQGVLGQVTNQFTGLANPFNSKPDASSQYRLAVSNFSSSVNTLISKPQQLSSSIGNLFSLSDNLSDAPKEKFNIAKSFFKFGQNTPFPPPTTIQRQQQIENNQALFSQMNISSLANAYNAAAEINFITEVDLNEIENILGDQFYYCIDNNNFNEEDLDALKELRIQVSIFFESSRVDIKRLIPITTNQTTITTLTYAYYNSLDNDSLITDINKIYTPNNIKGNLQIVSNQ